LQSRKYFKNSDITKDPSFGKDFNLRNSDGEVTTLEDFKGRVVVMFFGYTQCPDFCPTTLMENASSNDDIRAPIRKGSGAFCDGGP
jgi:protein SCO1/2